MIRLPSSQKQILSHSSYTSVLGLQCSSCICIALRRSSSGAHDACREHSMISSVQERISCYEILVPIVESMRVF